MISKSALSLATAAAIGLALAAAPAAASAGESVKGGKRLPMTAKDLKYPSKPPFGAAAQDKPAEVKAGAAGQTPTAPAARESAPKR